MREMRGMRDRDMDRDRDMMRGMMGRRDRGREMMDRDEKKMLWKKCEKFMTRELKFTFLHFRSFSMFCLDQGSHWSWKSWKVLEFQKIFFQDWKVLEF